MASKQITCQAGGQIDIIQVPNLFSRKKSLREGGSFSLRSWRIGGERANLGEREHCRESWIDNTITREKERRGEGEKSLLDGKPSGRGKKIFRGNADCLSEISLGEVKRVGEAARWNDIKLHDPLVPGNPFPRRTGLSPHRDKERPPFRSGKYRRSLRLLIASRGFPLPPFF